MMTSHIDWSVDDEKWVLEKIAKETKDIHQAKRASVK
jgi:hypothetical protein